MERETCETPLLCTFKRCGPHNIHPHDIPNIAAEPAATKAAETPAYAREKHAKSHLFTGVANHRHH